MSSTESGKLIKNTAVYGAGDIIVMAVSSFLLIPLYTRALSQEEYGIYIISKTNIDIFTYIVQFGLISAVSRLYFDYKKRNEQYEYISTVLILFFAIAAVFSTTMFLYGDHLWSMISPQISPEPYLWFCVAIAIDSFFPSLSSIWFRVEEKAFPFITIQIATALLLVAFVSINMLYLKTGVVGLLRAILLNSVCASSVIVVLLWGKFRLKPKISQVKASLNYALPIFAGYVAYFVLNRVGTVILQRYVPIDKIAVYGLMQQLSMVVTIAGNSFGMAFQPAIYSCGPDRVEQQIAKTGGMYLLVMLFISSALVLFGSDIIWLAAPPKYAEGYVIFVILVMANLAYSINMINNTILLYFKYPTLSVAITTIGGMVATALSMALVPTYNIYGASLASLTAFICVLVMGFLLTRKFGSFFKMKFIMRLAVIMLAVVLVGMFMRTNVPHLISLLVKTGLITALGYVLYSQYKKGDASPGIA